MKSCLVVVLLALIFAPFVLCDEYKSYDGHKLIRVTITTPYELLFIKKLELDVWTNEANVVPGPNDLLVSNEQYHFLVENEMHVEVLHDNFGEVIQAERAGILNRVPLPEVRTHNSTAASPFFDQFRPIEEINQYVQQLVASYPQLLTYNATIGSTLQGRPISSLRITSPVSGPKKRIYFEGLLHAREWVSYSTVLYIVENLVTLYSTDATVKNFLDKVEFYVVPVVNVDGYVFSWTNTRLWRKNRRQNTGGSFGVDLNRNWAGENWCNQGASKTPSAEDYCGVAPFSEPETQVIDKFAKSILPLNGFIDYHAYSQLVLRPWGYTRTPPSNDAVQKSVGDAYAAAIKATTGLTYTSEPSWNLYITTGCVDDYFKGYLSVPLAFTVELRPTGSNPGFVLPPAQIVPTGEENWAGFKTFVTYVINN